MLNKIRQKEFEIITEKLKNVYTHVDRACPLCESSEGRTIDGGKDFGFHLPITFCAEEYQIC